VPAERLHSALHGANDQGTVVAAAHVNRPRGVPKRALVRTASPRAACPGTDRRSSGVGIMSAACGPPPASARPRQQRDRQRSSLHQERTTPDCCAEARQSSERVAQASARKRPGDQAARTRNVVRVVISTANSRRHAP